MIVYDHTANTLKNISVEKFYGNHEGFFHGELSHLPIGKGKGLILSLFGEKYPLQSYFPTNLTGFGVSIILSSMSSHCLVGMLLKS